MGWLQSLAAEHGDELHGLSVRQIARKLGISKHKAHRLQRHIQAHQGTPVQQIRQQYSKWGGNATIEQLAARFGVSKRELQRLRKLHGWTHAMGALSDSQIEHGELDDLVAELLRIKRAGVELAAEDAERAQLERDATSWRSWQASTLDRLTQALGKLPRQISAPPIELGEAFERYALLWFPTDFHYGGYSWAGYGGEPYSRQQAATYLKTSTAKVLARLQGRPDRIIVPIGGDFFHVDTVHGTTTKGTPQDLDGVPEQIVVEGMRLLLDMLAVLRSVAPLTIVLGAGNHDKLLSLCAFELVRVYFRDDDGVDVVDGTGPYQLVEYGSTLLGVTHGDNKHSPRDLGRIMATSWPKQWGNSKHRLWCVGHRHHVKAEEGGGVLVLQCPSLAGSDRYHVDQGYAAESARALQCHMLSPDSGYMGAIYVALT